MRLLILTQAVNREHPVLGFFHRWLEEIAKRYEEVTVVCLEEGVHALPANVKVLSLGKERFGASPLRRLIYIRAFYRLIKAHRGEYDRVLVHMNPEYVILGGIFWKLWKKRIVFWYNHPAS